MPEVSEEVEEMSTEKKVFNQKNLLDFCVKNRMRITLAGIKGSGKSTLAMQIAKDVGLPLRTYVLTRETSESALLGYVKPDGTVVRTKLREAVENGGIVLLEESDAADPNIMVCLNTLDNGYIDFPDKSVAVHPDFMLIETTNTFADGEYHSGKFHQDSSVTDRSQVFIIDTAPVVSERVLEIRRAVARALEEKGFESVISNRSYYRLNAFLEEFDLSIKMIEEVLLSDMSKTDKERIVSDKNIVELVEPKIEDILPDPEQPEWEDESDVEPDGHPKQEESEEASGSEDEEASSKEYDIY